MIRYKLTNDFGDEVEISLDTKDQNDFVPLVFAGDHLAVTDVQDWLFQQSGPYGHTIREVTSPADLAYALGAEEAIANYNPEILEGGKIVESFDPGIGDDEMT